MSLSVLLIATMFEPFDIFRVGDDGHAGWLESAHAHLLRARWRFGGNCSPENPSARASLALEFQEDFLGHGLLLFHQTGRVDGRKL